MKDETKGKTILIVDDEKITVKLAKTFFERHGFSVIAAYDGTEALEIAESSRPDLILLDIMLPELDGFEVCRRLRSQTMFEKTPILMFTARGLMEDREQGMELGADEYIVKPFQGSELLKIVKKHLATPRE